MSQEGAEKIKGKLKELTALIKEEAAEDSAELREEIKSSINELKKELEEKWSKVDEHGEKNFFNRCPGGSQLHHPGAGGQGFFLATLRMILFHSLNSCKPVRL